MNPFAVLQLPSWLPGMSFKRKMATARAFSKHYLERPFVYSLRRVVRVISIIISYVFDNRIRQPGESASPSMVRDALQHIEKNGTSHEESWMKALKEACGTAFLGTVLGCPSRAFTHACH